MQFAAGDTILFYTDGITGAKNDTYDLFGDDRLDRFVASHRTDATALINPVLAEVRSFQGTRSAADDQTLLAVRVQ